VGKIAKHHQPKKNLTDLWGFRHCPADLEIACAVSVNLRVMQAYRLNRSCHISYRTRLRPTFGGSDEQNQRSLSPALAFLAFLPCSALGQAVYGSIYGTVDDATGALIPNAKIVITDTAKGTEVTAVANESGEFRVEHLIPDVYALSIDNPGFKKYEQSNIQVYADSSVKVVGRIGNRYCSLVAGAAELHRGGQRIEWSTRL
jgi:hypothetical protein